MPYLGSMVFENQKLQEDTHLPQFDSQNCTLESLDEEKDLTVSRLVAKNPVSQKISSKQLIETHKEDFQDS